MTKCKVKDYVNGNLHRAEFNGYSFDLIETTAGLALAQIWISKSSVREIFVPKVLSSEYKIDCIVRIDGRYDFVKDKPRKEKVRHFDKLIIDDDIDSVHMQAFSGLDVDEIHWPRNCKIIPQMCFTYCKAKTVTGIEEVEEIEMLAFAESDIKYIRWPDKCIYVSPKCFKGSSLTSIENIGCVDIVSEEAFAGCQLLSLTMPQPYCSFGKDSLYGVDPDLVTFPYFTSEEEKKNAFGN